MPARITGYDLPKQSDCELLLAREQRRAANKASPKYPLGRDHYIPLVMAAILPKLKRVTSHKEV